MRIHKEGYKTIIASLFISLTIVAMISLVWPGQTLFHILFYLLIPLFNVWVISFFRVPLRKGRFAENEVVSAADGRIVAIEEVYEDEFLQTSCRQVSVFMSPFNVHVNWYPVNGKVVYVKYHPGKYLVAFHPKSSQLNERSSIALQTSQGHYIMMRQIAGMLARRIVYYAKQHDEVTQGQEFGIIRFGSRVDFFLPLEARIEVKIGDKVRAKKTVIARFKET